MKVIINSSNEEFNKVEAFEILKRNLNFVLEVTPDIHLDKLKLVFTDSFTEEVEAFQRENNISRVGRSNGAVAKACDYEDSNGELNTTIFFDLSMFHSVLEVEANECPLELHFIQHEFGHVYDNHLMKSILIEDFSELDSLTLKENILFTLSQIAWTEFQANRIGVGVVDKTIGISNSNDILIKVFENYGNPALHCLTELSQQINSFREEILNSEGICKGIQHYTKKLIYYTSQFISIILAYELDEDENPFKDTFDEVLEVYRQLDFKEEFEELLSILKDLLQTYPKWEDFYSLAPLTEWVEAFWGTIGFEADDDLIFSTIL